MVDWADNAADAILLEWHGVTGRGSKLHEFIAARLRAERAAERERCAAWHDKQVANLRKRIWRGAPADALASRRRADLKAAVHELSAAAIRNQEPT